MKELALSIGILAYNEEQSLATTLSSLFGQSIFSNPVIGATHKIKKIEVVVVPNGCTDRTAAVAEAELVSHISQLDSNYREDVNLVPVVEELKQGGKSNAWNIYTHEISDQDADLIIMIDADIEFNQVETIYNSLTTLMDCDDSTVVVDSPLKSLQRKPNKTWIDRISLRVSQDYLDSGIGVAGSFYCARARTLRQIWMPAGLPGEDGFLKAMIITDMFRAGVDHGKIVRAEDASHFYIPETSISRIIRHELREIIGTSINCFLTWDFLLFATDPKGPGAGVVLRNLIEGRPEWMAEYLNNTIKNKGFWVLPRGMVTKRLTELKGKHPIGDFKTCAAAVLRFLFGLPLCLVANHKLKSGDGIGFW